MDPQRPRFCFPARRLIYQAEALSWLSSTPTPPDCSVVTSLPDVSEMSPMSLTQWRHWFESTVVTILRWVPANGFAIFFQSDIRIEGRWIDKGYMVMRAAESVGADLIWHKIVCRKPPGSISQGRPTYAHLICLASPLAVNRPVYLRPGPDILADGGYKSWPRAMGDAACELACRYLADETPTRTIVDPFCGEGSILAAANAIGLESVGIDLSPRRCRLAGMR